MVDLSPKVLLVLIAIFALNGCKSDAKSTGPQPISFTIPRVEFDRDIYTTTLPEELAMRNHTVFNEVFQVSRVTGLSVCILDLDQGLWSDFSGLEDRESNKMIKSTSRYHAGSVGKIATSVLIQQLLEQRKFSLDTRIDKWFPTGLHAKRINIEQLLNHSAGLPRNLAKDPANSETTAQLVVRALDLPLAFSPGSGFTYSNIGYVALGAILEKEYDLPLSDIIQRHFIQPTGLALTSAITPDNSADLLINSTHHGQLGAKTIDYSSPEGAGILASTPCDLVKIMHALLAGKLVNSNTLDTMQDIAYPMSADGSLNWSRGLMILNAPFGNVMYLNGRINGFGASVAYHPELDTFVAVMLNDDSEVGPFLMRFFTEFNERQAQRAPS